MSDIERLELCEVCGKIATDQVVTEGVWIRFFCLNHLPANVTQPTNGREHL